MSEKESYRPRMNNLIILPVIFCLFRADYSQASESWYVVNNYVGTIGKYPVHLSIQLYNFNNDINVEGSYYYDHYNSPIALFGKEKEGDIVLCEVSGKDDFEKYIIQGSKYEAKKCTLRIKKHGDNLEGEWVNENIKMNVTLSRISSMNENSIMSKDGKLDIPFWGDTNKHLFIGVYKQDKDRIAINQVKVISKDNGKLIQVINPQRENCDFGFYMTPIYQNLERSGISSISLNCYSTKSEFSIKYRLKGGFYKKTEY